MVAIDNTVALASSSRAWTLARATHGNPRRTGASSPRLVPARWEELTPEEHQRYPGDYEAQAGQGPITFHSEEHLASSDKGVAMLRRIMTQQLAAIAEGRDPIGVTFGESAPPVRFEAGNFLVDS